MRVLDSLSFPECFSHEADDIAQDALVRAYVASGTGGIINIVSRKTSLEGFSGLVSANYGFNHFVTANAAISYNRPKASYRFSYNTKYEDDIVNTTLQRHVKESAYNVLQQMQATRYTYNNNIVDHSTGSCYVVRLQKQGSQNHDTVVHPLFCHCNPVNTLVLDSVPAFGAFVSTIARKCLTLTMFFIGASLSTDVLRAVGIKPLIQGVLLWIVISIGSLLYIIL